MSESLRSRLLQFDWHKSEPLHALLCLPGVALPLIVGIHYGYPGTAALMVGGAQCVGFGSYQQPLFHRSGAMVYATLGIALSALVGALCRDSTVALVCATVVWAFLYGMSNSIGAATSWVCQQCCIFLIISSAAPSTLGSPQGLVHAAWLRGAGVLAGGALQALFLRILLHWLPQARTQFTSPDFDPTRFERKFLREQLSPRSGAFQFSIRMVVTGVLAIVLFRSMTWTSAYWIGMTALLLPKPEFSATLLRGILRAAGTILGAAICTAIVIELHPQGQLLGAIVLIFLFVGYLLNTVNYGAFATALTGYICFVLAVAHQPPREVLLHRILATLIGSGIALGVHAAFLLGRRLLGIATPVLSSLEERL